jgi:DMSO/TMAO reductase YedYZ molybdopterin-dependent catalytic subunit
MQPVLRRDVAFACGAAAGITLLGIWYAPYGAGLTPFPPFDLVDLIIRRTPGSLATWAIESLEHRAQPVLHVSSLLGVVLAWGALGLILRRWPNSLIGVLLSLIPLPALVWLTTWADTDSSAATAAWHAVAVGSNLALAGWLLGRWVAHLDADQRQRHDGQIQAAGWRNAPDTFTRRAVVRGIALTAVAAGLGGGAVGALLQRARVGEPATAAWTPLEDVRAAARSTGLPNVVTPTTPAPLPPVPEPLILPGDARSRITSNRDFYVVDISFRKPVIPESEWRLRVHGLVEHELTLTYADLLALPTVELDGTLMCISYTHDNNLISSTRWTGARLRDVLALAGVRDSVYDVACHGTHGYSDSILIPDAMRADTLLAYGMNGTTLPREHGFPCRLYVPGLYGEKNVKWLQEIELVQYNYLGYWQERGWTDIAIINTTSTIDTPRTVATRDAGGIVPVTGIAFAGERGVSHVEVQADDGDWQAAELEPYDPALLWQRWLLQWQATPGEHTLTVRCVDGLGNRQAEAEAPPHPDGMTGLHSVRVVVA